MREVGVKGKEDGVDLKSVNGTVLFSVLSQMKILAPKN